MNKQDDYTPISLTVPEGLLPYLHTLASQGILGASALDVALYFLRTGLHEHLLRNASRAAPRLASGGSTLANCASSTPGGGT